jgi:DNA-binding transcriptional regulator YbjK
VADPNAPAQANLPRAEQRRLGILDATLRVIAAGGVDAVTHRRVAAEAGVSLGATTYYFKSRDEMVLEAFRYYITRCMSDLASLERELGHLTPESLVDLAVEFTRREFTDPDLIRAEYELIMYAVHDDDLAREFRTWQRALDSQLAEAFEELGSPQPMDAARTMTGICRAYELECLTHPGRDIDHLRRRLELVLPGLLGGTAPT